MRVITISAFVAICGFAIAQVGGSQQGSEIKLGPTVPVGVRVSQAQWHPNGQAIMYTRNEENGVGIGIYALGQYEGKVVLNIPKDETYRWHWLEGSKSGLAVVTKEIKDGKAPTKQIRIFLVEGETQSMRQIYNEVMDAKAVSGVGVNASPLLKHAIVSFYGEKGVKNYVLCSGRGDLINSLDLDNATSKGLYPSWSIDGTAVFSELRKGTARVLSDVPITFKSADGLSGSGNANGGDLVVTGVRLTAASGTVSEVSGPVTTISLRASPMAPETGSNVLEMMPSNGVLRPVRFRGPFVREPRNAQPLIQKNQAIMVQFDKSNAQDNSVWLKRGPQAGTPATLVAVHASDTWLAPKENAVAYVIDGALFIRPILKN